MTEALIQPKIWTQIEARNPRAAYRSTSEMYLWNMEVDEKTWLTLKRLPKNAVLDLLIRFHDGELKETDAKAEDVAAVVNAPPAAPDAQAGAKEKKAKQKGPYSLFWQELFKHGFTNEPSVKAWLDKFRSDLAPTDKDVLHWQLNVESLTFVSPDQLVDVLKGVSRALGLPMENAIRMVTAAEEKAVRQ